LLKNILESTLAGYWDWNLVDNTEYLSPTFKRMFGYEDHEMESSPEAWQKILFPEDLPGVLEVFDRHIKSRGQEPYYNEIRYQHKSGSTVWVACAGRIIEWADDGTPIRMVGCHIDITERKQAELALSKSRKIMAQAEELADLGSWEWNIQNDTWLLSDNWKRIHGVADIQLTTPQLLPIAHPEDKTAIEHAFARATENGKPYNIEHRIIRPDTGEVRHVHSRGLVERDDNGNPATMIGTVQDITGRKKAEEEIKQINQQLQKSNAEKDKLFSVIAHDLKSPMSGLVGSTQMLAKEPQLFSEHDFTFIATEMHKNAVNTFALLEDLLQWSRMNQGGIDYAPTPSCMEDLMTMGLSTGQDMAKAKDIAIRKHIPQGLKVLVDQPMLKTVIRNILFNAIKFTHRGGEIVIKARQEGQMVTLAIQDNGIGMNEQIMSSAFSPKKEKRQMGTEGEKGTGLGLVLCKQFIEQHSGEIWVESMPGQGTTVHFTLPAAS
ncbi:MAG: PAS domain-containing protein, partial [Candidatus Syntrophosphaera sp.]